MCSYTIQEIKALAISSGSANQFFMRTGIKPNDVISILCDLIQESGIVQPSTPLVITPSKSG